MQSASNMLAKTKILVPNYGPFRNKKYHIWTFYIASWELESHSVHDEVGRKGQH